jgi:acetyl esterase/lipase
VSEPLWLDIYRPYDHYAKNSSDKRPALVFFNGGGYIGMNEDAAEFALQAAQRGMIGISVKYRVGVHPHFTGRLDSLIHYLPFYQKTIYRAVQDARDAVRFVFNNAATYNIDPNRIFVGGHSAGGSLILNYAYVGQNDFPANMATELGSLAAKTPIAGLIPYAAPFNTTSFTSPVDPLSYIQGNENEPIFMIHGTCDSAAYFNRGNPFDPSSLYNVGAYGLACKKQELNQPYHLLAIKGGDHTFSTEQAMVYESLFKWIKQKSICGTPDRACETVTVVNNQPCALVSLCPTCRPNRVVDNPEVQIQVYPNPTVDYLTIQVSMNRKTMDVPKVLIYNAFGQLLETGVLTKNTEGVYFRQFSTAQLSSGIYWLRFYADGQVWMEKMFVKL